MKTNLLASLCAVSLAWAGPIPAQSVFSSSGTKSGGFENALKVLDGRASEQYSGSVRYQPRPKGDQAPAYRGSYRGLYLDMARAAAVKHSIPEDLFLRLVQQESGWNPNAESHAGALGLAQLMPDTALRLGVDPTDPEQNLDGGARYLRQQYVKFRSWRLALAAYNAGPEAVVKYDGVPPFKETEGYVLAILGS